MSRKKEVCTGQSLNKIETKICTILKSLDVSFRTQVSVDKYNVDFLINDKYIIEVYGDFWHCNPQKYPAEYYNRGKKKTAAEIWQRDQCRKEKFEALGYKFLSLWESEINANYTSLCKKIKRHIKNS